MKVSDLIVKSLEAEGVKYIFGLPGEETEDLLFSIANSSIVFVPARHEQGAAFMADVWGRLTGKAGVCLATLGPGATNLITGLADAHLDKSPVVAITAQGSMERLHKESHQAIDIVNMFKPIVKWNTQISHPEITAEAVRKAFKLAEMEKPGVTHIEVPEDIAKMEVKAIPLEPMRVRRSAPEYKAIQKAAELLKSAKRPLIIAGNGAIRKLASKHLREFVTKTHIPVVSTFMGKGAVSDKDEHSLFSVGLKMKDYVMCAIDAADVIITIGYDVAEYDPENWNHKKDKKIIHIDFSPAEVYEYYQPAIELVCDISGALWELNNAVEQEKNAFTFTNWALPVRKLILADFATYSLEDGKPFTIPGALQIIRECMHDEDILLSDVGSHKMWIARNYPSYSPNTVIVSNGLASMGIALPGGLAAKLVHPERRIVAACGDGGFLMNSQEIETAKRMGIGYTIIVFNDNNYGLITWKQEAHTGKSFGTALTNPDFKLYAESFGIKGYSPNTLDELKQNLQEAISSQELCIVEIKVNPSKNQELNKKLAQKVCPILSL
ncbi:acetolactate synthase large subunit [Candidatus Woesearchaeota archaeon]|nr:acetolactate synthase large subunit [Candidatus Woesearchaeota archaeon]